MIIITSIKQPEQGAVMIMHCEVCRVSVITISIHAKKPDDGDLWVVQLCPHGLIHSNKKFMYKDQA